MTYQAPSHAEMLEILKNVRTIALVGASDKPERPSYHVMQFLQSRGYRVIPVNPGLAGQALLGEPVFESVSVIPQAVDMVEIFRASEAVGPIVDEAIEKGAAVIWMQLGVINPEAAERALTAGLKVVMNHCPAIELQ